MRKAPGRRNRKITLYKGYGPRGPISGEISASSLLKWPNSVYRPALPDRRRDPRSRTFKSGLLGRSQAVRQGILIPPFGGSIPPAPATHSGLLRDFPRGGWKSRLFLHSLWSPGSPYAEVEAEIPESLRPFPRIFPLAETIAEDEFEQDCRPSLTRWLSRFSRLDCTRCGIGRSYRRLAPRESLMARQLLTSGKYGGKIGALLQNSGVLATKAAGHFTRDYLQLR